jgi:hypothetical protein
MSSHPESSNSLPPVVKDKNPHNYRKVGYSLIVISVSLVLIALLILEVGGNYHFSGDIMAKQEITAMTPKHGYTIVAFDYTQPVGAKIQLLGAANDFAGAVQMKNQYTPNYNGQKGQVLIFDTSTVNNTNSVSLSEVYAMTPTSVYNVVSFNTAMPVGARLAPQTLDSLLGAAINDSARYATANSDTQVQILTFTSSFDDNLKQIAGASYDPMLVSENINQIKLTPPKLIPPPPVHVVQNTTSVTVPANTTIVNAAVKTTNTSVTLSDNNTKPNMTAGTKMNTVSMIANVTTSGSSNHIMAISNNTSSNNTKQ